MDKLSDYEKESLSKLFVSISKGKWSNEGLVQLIELAGDHLNLRTAPDYAKQENISDKGARIETKIRKLKKLFNVTFVIDNY